MNEIINSGSQTVPLDWLRLLIGLSISIMLGMCVSAVYRWTHRGVTYERTFLVTLAAIPTIVCLVMMLIGSNLALSLGMVGALSIIRFRTVIKDSRDMVYLFWCIAIGLGAGTYNWSAAVISSIFIGMALSILFYVEFGKPSQFDCVLVVKGTGKIAHERFGEIIERFTLRAELRNLDTTEDGYEGVYEVLFKSREFARQQELIDELRGVSGVSSISLLVPKLTIPV